ncbi:uncharacterized protein LOC124298752 [Neodiprion virginianus]|uniref:uncharacterized protein LOC124298752 n=1 Tax=Neodiprion virginianus TaxID=2961670 RepID=UPI001EE75242|nr:uncharacterized protein LOC124298752 [Neodiprion virginianus]XP_046607130.1 uncharacterized protein LOC124298752 [Neodiprion virginianus]
MTDLSTTVAHLTKLGTSIVCMKYFNDPYSILVSDNHWATRAFQILLFHSILGIFRFGNPSTSKYLRGFYTLFSKIIHTLPFALIVTEILHWNKTSEQITLTLLILTVFPIVYESRSKERTRRHLIDVAVGLNLCALIYVSLISKNYSAISLVVSYAFTHFLLEDISDRYDVPYRDLLQYSLCFMEIFSILTLKDLQGNY